MKHGWLRTPDDVVSRCGWPGRCVCVCVCVCVHDKSAFSPPLSDRVPGRVKSVSQGSGVGYDSDSVEMHPMDECLEAQYYHVQCRLGEGGRRDRKSTSVNSSL